MNPLKKQIHLYSERTKIKTDMKPIHFSPQARRYIQRILFSHSSVMKKIFFLFLGISLIEISIPLWLNRSLEQASYQLDVSFVWTLLFGMLALLVLYLVLSYFSISLQKKVSLDIVNQVREDWLKWYLHKKVSSLSDGDKGNLYVKISYHLSLLQLGINSSFFVFFQWIIFAGGILVVTALLDTRLLLISLLFIPINALVFFVSYVLSSYYLAKDQTLYSKLLRYISDTFHTFPLIKALNQEKAFLDKVRHIVELDNYFRIKREVVLRFGNSIIFVALALIGAGIYLINLYLPFFQQDSAIAGVVQVLVMALHLRLIYLSLRMGLFSFPLKLGTFLCIPPRSSYPKEQTLKHISSLRFHAKKVKLGREAEYTKDLTLTFTKDERALVYISHDSYPFAQLFSGVAEGQFGKNWVVTVNEKKRFLYDRYSETKKKIFYINPDMTTELSLYDFLGDYKKVESLHSFSLFKELLENKRFLGLRMNKQEMSVTERWLVQFAYCLIHRPDVIVIDPLITDSPYAKVQEARELLLRELSDTIVITVTYLAPAKKSDYVIYTV